MKISDFKFGLPSKGRLYKSSVDWLKICGLHVEASAGGRKYGSHLNGIEGVSISLLPASEIPKALSSGLIHLGITGQDLLREKIPYWSQSISELSLLGFGRASLVLAVPNFWVDVESLDDFDSVAIRFRKSHGFRLRIATKYHNLVWNYLRKMGVADYQLVDSQGATEGSIKNLAAEAIADITSTGKTIKENNLKVIGEPILNSEGTLFLSKRASWSEEQLKIFEDFCFKVNIDGKKFLDSYKTPNLTSSTWRL